MSPESKNIFKTIFCWIGIAYNLPLMYFAYTFSNNMYYGDKTIYYLGFIASGIVIYTLFICRPTKTASEQKIENENNLLKLQIEQKDLQNKLKT